MDSSYYQLIALGVIALGAVAYYVIKPIIDSSRSNRSKEKKHNKKLKSEDDSSIYFSKQDIMITLEEYIDDLLERKLLNITPDKKRILINDFSKFLTALEWEDKYVNLYNGYIKFPFKIGNVEISSMHDLILFNESCKFINKRR